jgi:hypothetical protein
MNVFLKLLRALLAMVAVLSPTSVLYAAASGAREIEEKDIPLNVADIAPGKYFRYHHQESNSAFPVTNGGVL